MAMYHVISLKRHSNAAAVVAMPDANYNVIPMTQVAAAVDNDWQPPSASESSLGGGPTGYGNPAVAFSTLLRQSSIEYGSIKG